MKLLVSVTDAEEARAAVAGGADVVDAKDPTRGALGPVSLDALSEIRATLGGARPLSAALGDAADERAIGRAARAAAAAGAEMVKVGFAGIASERRVQLLLEAAVRGARDGHPRARTIAVAYADAARAQSVSAQALVALAERAGAAGVLLDTAVKDGGGLFARMLRGAVLDWVKDAHAASLLAALAGQLSGNTFERACGLGADVVGVRGAACDGGRDGFVSTVRVRALATTLRQHDRGGEEKLRAISALPYQTHSTREWRA